MLDDFSFVFKEKISDHKPIIAGNILSWNMLCLAKPSNNGFHMDETAHYGERYFARLKRVVGVINSIVQVHPEIDIICLQESPYLPEYKSIFLSYFVGEKALEKFDVDQRIESRTDSYDFQLMTFCSDRYQTREVTNELKVGDNNQHGRYHLIELMDLSSGIRSHIGNVHLKWFPKRCVLRQKVTNRVVRYLVTKHHCTLAGDFNKTLSWVTEDRLMKESMKAFFYPRSNSYAKEGFGKKCYDQVDAVILV